MNLSEKIKSLRLAAGHNQFTVSLCGTLAEICDLAAEAAQNWRFFEVAAATHKRESQRADDWREVAIELARHVRPGWDDSDAALAAFKAQASKVYAKPAMTPPDITPGAIAALVTAARNFLDHADIEVDDAALAHDIRAALAPFTTDPAPVSPAVSLAFVPQEWIGDYAREVEPPGDWTWSVPAAEFLALFPTWESFLENHEDRDGLRSHDNAPEWVRDWEGPFEVTLENPHNDPWEISRDILNPL